MSEPTIPVWLTNRQLEILAALTRYAESNIDDINEAMDPTAEDGQGKLAVNGGEITPDYLDSSEVMKLCDMFMEKCLDEECDYAEMKPVKKNNFSPKVCMTRTKGKFFTCSCGSNKFFRHVDLSLMVYKCCACRIEYQGTVYGQIDYEPISRELRQPTEQPKQPKPSEPEEPPDLLDSWRKLNPGKGKEGSES